MRPLWVTHQVYGCHLFQVGQWGMGEEEDQLGWSPLLRLDPVAHQRRSRRLLRQDLTFGQGWLSGKDMLGLLNRHFFRCVFFFYIYSVTSKKIISCLKLFMKYKFNLLFPVTIICLLYFQFHVSTWGRQVTMEENTTAWRAVQFLTQKQAPYCTQTHT